MYAPYLVLKYLIKMKMIFSLLSIVNILYFAFPTPNIKFTTKLFL